MCDNGLGVPSQTETATNDKLTSMNCKEAVTLNEAYFLRKM